MIQSKIHARSEGHWIITKPILPFFFTLILALPCNAYGQSWSSPTGKYSSAFKSAEATKPADNPIELKAWIVSEPGKRSGYLVVAAKLSTESYLYALTQEGVSATKIEVATHDGFEINGAFRPTKPPILVEKDPVFGERQEKHFGEIEFFLPIKIAPGQTPEDLKIDVRLNGQVCTGDSSCIPIRDRVIQARFGDYLLRTDRQYEANTDGRFGTELPKIR